MARMASLAVAGTETMRSCRVDISMAMKTTMRLTQGSTKAQTNSDPDSEIII